MHQATVVGSLKLPSCKMQSIFRLPWCTDQIAPKMSDKAALEGICASPVVDMSMLNKLKRKRTDSPEAGAALKVVPNKRQRADIDDLQKAQTGVTRPAIKSEREPSFAPTQTIPAMATQAPSMPVAHIPEGSNTAPTATDTESTQMDHTRADLRRNPAGGSDSAAIKFEDAVMQEVQTNTVTDVTGLTPLQQVIENQFNMQILMKHNELRLIEQELAKCQIALEQLRRCEVRPFPGYDSLSACVSAGTGPSIAPPPGYTRPSHPAPYGVTDGPYTRHYQQWLLRDPAFDALPLQSPGWADGTASSSAIRSTRNSGSARKPASKTFSMPPRPTDSLQSIPNYPAPAFKDKTNPLILRRSTDNQLVKLICNNCHRGNFSSIQGFLNHCRIAHKVDYKSHDAAAVDCGRLLDEQEAASLPLETQNVPAHKPSASRGSSAVSTPFKNLVHPMNMTFPAPSPSTLSQRRDRSSIKPAVATRNPLSTKLPGSLPSPFKPSQQAPHLSAHFAKHKIGGNLEQAIAAAKQAVDFGAEDDNDSPDGMESTSPSTPMPGSRTVAGVVHAGSSAPPNAMARAPSRKGVQPPAQRHRPSPLAPTQPTAHVPHRHKHGTHGEVPESPQGPSPNLSPHTADSNPGLVSDHEDDDHASASEDEGPHSDLAPPLAVGRNCSDNMEIDVTVDQGIDEHSVVIRRNSMLVADDGLRSVGSPSRKLAAGKHGK